MLCPVSIHSSDTYTLEGARRAALLQQFGGILLGVWVLQYVFISGMTPPHKLLFLNESKWEQKTGKFKIAELQRPKVEH